MSDKYERLEMPAEEVPRFYAGIINKLGDERDALRAENQRLHEECRLAAELQIRTGQIADAENQRAAATNRDLWRELGLARDLNGALRTERDDYAARLKATDQSWTKIAAENERLRLALRWVCEDAGVAIDGDYLTHADGEYAAPISDVHRSLVELVRSMGGP